MDFHAEQKGRGEADYAVDAGTPVRRLVGASSAIGLASTKVSMMVFFVVWVEAVHFLDGEPNEGE